VFQKPLITGDADIQSGRDPFMVIAIVYDMSMNQKVR
jgi:hypothetical protein